MIIFVKSTKVVVGLFPYIVDKKKNEDNEVRFSIGPFKSLCSIEPVIFEQGIWSTHVDQIF